jgi:hypothetical protein
MEGSLVGCRAKVKERLQQWSHNLQGLNGYVVGGLFRSRRYRAKPEYLIRQTIRCFMGLDVVVVANSRLSKLVLRYEGSRYGWIHFSYLCIYTITDTITAMLLLTFSPHTLL